jgi:hypothetical protein
MGGMFTQDTGHPRVGEGIYTIEAEFFTEHFVVRGEITCPDMRLSDHLNSSAPSIEIRPQYVERIMTGSHIDLPGAHAHLTKAHLLFTLPISEPERPPRADNVAWTWTMNRRAWAGLGRYTLVGRIHAEAGRDPRLILRSLEHRQFLPFTESTLTMPDGSARSAGTVIINRHNLEMLALRDD